MEKYSAQSACSFRVYNYLQNIGFDKQAAEDAVSCYRYDLLKINEFTKQLPCDSAGLVTTLVLLELMLTKCTKPHYSLFHHRNRLNSHFLDNLDHEDNHQDITSSYAQAMKELVKIESLSVN